MISGEVEDRDLIRRARRGNIESYNVLVSRWEKRIYNYLLRLVGDREDALDLAQEVFLKAYRSLGKLKEDGRFAAWLFRIAHNEAFSLLRRRREEGEPGQPLARETLSYRLYPLEIALAVERALNSLPAEQREAVILKIYQGLKFEEMAEVLDCPVSTVKSRLYTALDRLKEMLAPARASDG